MCFGYLDGHLGILPRGLGGAKAVVYGPGVRAGQPLEVGVSGPACPSGGGPGGDLKRWSQGSHFFLFFLNGGNELTPSSPWTLQGSFSPFSGSARSIESNCRAPCKGSLASGGCFFTYLLSSKLVFGSGGLEATGCLPIQRER